MNQLRALTYRRTVRKLRQQGAITLLGNNHRITTIQGNIEVWQRIALQIIRHGLACGFLRGINQQPHGALQRQLLLHNHPHGNHHRHNTVLIVLRTAPIQTPVYFSQRKRIKLGAVIQHPIRSVGGDNVGVGVQGHQLRIASRRARQGDLIDAVINIAEGQAKLHRQRLQPRRYPMENRIVILRHRRIQKRRNCHQLF